MNPIPSIIVLAGPTAVGKTAAAVELAERLGTEIISADSRQVFRGMDIGTSKPSREDRMRVRHHLIDVADPDESFSAGRFVTLARPVVESLHRSGRIPIVAGGTGLYIRSLVRGLWEGPPADWVLRGRLMEEESRSGAGTLHEKLRDIDPESADRINPRDLPKLIRAIEVYEKTGAPISAGHHRHRAGADAYRAVIFGLSRDRADLYRRVESRVDEMMAAGFEAEVRGLLAAGYSAGLPSMKGLGYRQMIGFLEGRTGREEAVRLIKRDTRRYAKRQWTWFNADPSVRWIRLGPEEGTGRVLSEINEAMRHRNREETVHAEG